jgi:hypothetical protein
MKHSDVTVTVTVVTCCSATTTAPTFLIVQLIIDVSCAILIWPRGLPLTQS